jgi:hypothetical protein
VLARAAQTTGRDAAGLLKDVAARLAAEVTNADEVIASRERAEWELVDEMRAARVRTTAAGLLADDKVVDRVIRAEAHFQRQLDRALGLLDKMQERRRDSGAAGAPVEPAGAVVIGFDLQRMELAAEDATPRSVGALRAVVGDGPADDPNAGLAVRWAPSPTDGPG